jgi:hypothetical protein
MDHCIAREYELVPNVSVVAVMTTRPPVPRLRYFHAVPVESGNPAAETVCSQRFDDIDPSADWQGPTLHTVGVRCPDCLEDVPVSGQPYPSRL